MKLLNLVAVTALLMMLIGCSSAPDDIVISYCKALDAGKIEEAESFLSKDASATLQSAGGKWLLAEAGSKFKQRKGISKIKITRKKITGNSAVVEFVYNFKDGTKFGDSFPLVKENGAWKISR